MTDMVYEGPGMFARRLAAVVIAALLVLPTAGAAAQPVLAYVAAKNANPKRLEVFKKGLSELGYAEGQNIRIEYR
jgi:putative ABC transport system substrate-binding protein